MAAIEVLFFGELTDLTGLNQKKYDAIDTEQLLKLVLGEYPDLEHKNFQIALNQQLLKEKKELKANDVLALLPPFSGG